MTGNAASRPIASPSPEQLNEAIAGYMGLEKYQELRRYRGGSEAMVVRWRNPGDDYGNYCPDYSTDLNLMALVEARLLAEGKGAHYYVEVKRLLTHDADERGDWHPGGDRLITADPLTRAKAAVAVLGLDVGA